jgi:glyoxylate/hydroxypyruvate reductase A
MKHLEDLAIVKTRSRMSIAFVAPTKDPAPWAIALNTLAPDIDIQIWSQERDSAAVEMALCWQHPSAMWRRYPNLRCVSSLGAGVDHLLQDPALPESLPILRLTDPLLAQSMFEYVCAAAMSFLRDFDVYQRQQEQRRWHQHPTPMSADTTVGIMGLGQLGGYAAQRLAELGFKVMGWSRSPKSIPGVESYVENPQLSQFLAQAQILVCLLPLTSQTEGILNRGLFAQLPPGACLINVARGEHLIEADLLTALDEGHLGGAYLDVFRQEPLPQDHPFWLHPAIRVTPHCSSVTNPQSVAPQIVDNYRRLQAGKPLLNEVSRSLGY